MEKIIKSWTSYEEVMEKLMGSTAQAMSGAHASLVPTGAPRRPAGAGYLVLALRELTHELLVSLQFSLADSSLPFSNTNVLHLANAEECSGPAREGGIMKTLSHHMGLMGVMGMVWRRYWEENHAILEKIMKVCRKS